jgi:hypothetical protein
MIRHVATLIVFNLTNFYMQLCVMMESVKQYTDNNVDPAYAEVWWIWMFKVFAVNQGFFMASIRFTEPYFFKIVYTKVRFYLCCGDSRT